MKRVASCLVVAVILFSVSCAKAEPPKPNFAGSWTFDVEATKANAIEAKVDGLALFLEHFTATQDVKAFSLKVDMGQNVLTAVYNLDGSVSKNMSPSGVPGQEPIEVVSTAGWDGMTLVIASTSSSASANGPIEVKSIRKMWFDAQGRLVIERSGTPVTMVRTSRSVYTKTQ